MSVQLFLEPDTYIDNWRQFWRNKADTSEKMEGKETDPILEIPSGS